MYCVETRVLKQAVKRNIDRFPKDFMFQLTKNEWHEVITTCDNLMPFIKFRQIGFNRPSQFSDENKIL
jgi:hypothetical protein